MAPEVEGARGLVGGDPHSREVALAVHLSLCGPAAALLLLVLALVARFEEVVFDRAGALGQGRDHGLAAATTAAAAGGRTPRQLLEASGQGRDGLTLGRDGVPLLRHHLLEHQEPAPTLPTSSFLHLAGIFRADASGRQCHDGGERPYL